MWQVRELKAAVTQGDLARINSALRFGLAHLGSAAGDGKAALSTLLQGSEACTLIHDAAKRGHADILVRRLVPNATTF